MKSRILREYAPDFAGDYSPSDHTMIKASGNGVQSKNVKKMKAAGHSSLKSVGEPFGSKKKRETVAMCDVDEDGVEHEPQGKHVSKQGNPLEVGEMEKVGRDWPTKPKNSGGNMEVVDGTRYEDGGVLKSSMSEWSIQNLAANMIGEDYNLMDLFEQYASTNKFVTLEGFQELCEASEVDASLDEVSMQILASQSKKFVFEEEEPGVFRVVNEYADTSDFDFSNKNSITRSSPKSLPSMHQDEIEDDEFGDDEFGDDEFGDDEGFDEFGDDEELGDDDWDDEEFEDEYSDDDDIYNSGYAGLTDVTDRHGDMNDFEEPEDRHGDLGDDMFDDTL